MFGHLAIHSVFCGVPPPVTKWRRDGSSACAWETETLPAALGHCCDFWLQPDVSNPSLLSVSNLELWRFLLADLANKLTLGLLFSYEMICLQWGQFFLCGTPYISISLYVCICIYNICIYTYISISIYLVIYHLFMYTHIHTYREDGVV